MNRTVGFGGCILINVCVITDNEYLYEHFLKIIDSREYQNYKFHFFFSFSNTAFLEKYKGTAFCPLDLKGKDAAFFSQYDLFLSLHCKQIFPKRLVDHNICINIHPGYNPYNRGWYPQVFGLINKLPIGVTIHRMDEQLDHGPIIFQRMVKVFEHDTSYDIYQRIQRMEVSMLKAHLPDILSGQYTEFPLCEAGNINTKKDFTDLCQIDLEQEATYGEVIDYLRAMTFPGHKNAFFTTKTGHKVYVTIMLEPEKDDSSEKGASSFE